MYLIVTLCITFLDILCNLLGKKVNGGTYFNIRHYFKTVATLTISPEEMSTIKRGAREVEGAETRRQQENSIKQGRLCSAININKLTSFVMTAIRDCMRKVISFPAKVSVIWQQFLKTKVTRDFSMLSYFRLFISLELYLNHTLQNATWVFRVRWNHFSRIPMEIKCI